jgi:ferredoxin-NADP reductase
VPVRLPYSVRSLEDVLYLRRRARRRDDRDIHTALAVGRTGPTGRLTTELVKAHAHADGSAFLCGSHGFVDSAVQMLADHGLARERIKTERWEATGPIDHGVGIIDSRRARLRTQPPARQAT